MKLQLVILVLLALGIVLETATLRSMRRTRRVYEESTEKIIKSNELVAAAYDRNSQRTKEMLDFLREHEVHTSHLGPQARN